MFPKSRCCALIEHLRSTLDDERFVLEGFDFSEDPGFEHYDISLTQSRSAEFTRDQGTFHNMTGMRCSSASSK